MWDGRRDAKRMEPKTPAIRLTREMTAFDLHINRLLADGTELSMDLARVHDGRGRVQPECKEINRSFRRVLAEAVFIFVKNL